MGAVVHAAAAISPTYKTDPISGKKLIVDPSTGKLKKDKPLERLATVAIVAGVLSLQLALISPQKSRTQHESINKSTLYRHNSYTPYRTSVWRPPPPQ